MCDRVKATQSKSETPGASQDGATKADRTAAARAKRLRKKAREADLKEAGRKAQKGAAVIQRPPKIKALLNGGVGDGGGGKDSGKGGKGKGKAKLKDRTSDTNESICFNWGKNKPCHTTPCPHKHVCRICEGDHKTVDHKW